MIGERISCEQADILLYYLHNIKEIQAVKVYDRTADVTISYIGERADIIHILRRFQYENVKVPNGLLENSGRELNNTYQEKLIGKVISHYARKLLRRIRCRHVIQRYALQNTSGKVLEIW